jgi:V-type H+-transporting ATPase subunit E
VVKEKTIEAEKKRLMEQYEKDVNVAEVNLKIARSAEMNRARILKMRKTNEIVESLLSASKLKMAEKLAEDRDSYAELLKSLLIQGLIKLIEPRVVLKIRKSDADLIDSIIEDAVVQYKALMIDQVKALEGKSDIPCEVLVDTKNYLPEFNAEDPNHSCLGGFILFCKKNRIVCSQTLDDRMSLVYGQAIPDIRSTLFPSLVKPPRLNRLDAVAMAAAGLEVEMRA